jgi:Superfamily II DNA/RNA helicases, SNF2 family
VGLGKTIEAGLILTELQARQIVQRVLVVCPASLTPKWHLELKKRFGEKFEIITAKKFMEYLEEYEENPHGAKINGIISFESIRQKNVLEQLEAIAPGFDLVIVDEAHHMRNFGRKQRNAGLLLSRNADAMLLLTATPIHLGSDDLFSLLNIMDDEEFPDLYTADKRFQSNEPIVKAQICLGQIPANIQMAKEIFEQIPNTSPILKNPLFAEVTDKLNSITNPLETNVPDKRLLLDIQRDLTELNLIGHIFTRTRKREVHTAMGVRKAFPIRLTFTDLERRFYEAVTAYVRAESESRFESPLIQKWVLNTPQRRMASSIPAMVEFYRNNLGFDENDYSEDSGLLNEDFDENLTDPFSFESARERLKAILKSWPKDAPDSKYDEFIKILKGMKEKEGLLKVMVFAFFKATLFYLKSRLIQEGFKCDIICGDVSPDERDPIVQKFQNDPHFEILLSSKVGSEGLDFQFCDTLFNYDLPWNPMEVEQRIGRLDRIGQQSQVIRIYNFWIEGTIEQRILDRLYSRIGVFERSIGELEMILGDEFSTLERDLLSKKLTPEEEIKFLEQKEMVIVSRMKELEKLEKNAAQFIGTDQFFDEEVEMIRERRRFITGEQLRRFLVDFIKTECPRSRLEYDSPNYQGKLYPDERLQSLLGGYFEPSDQFRYFSSASAGIPITFDSQTAFDHPNHDFINILHPLTRSVVNYYSGAKKLYSNAHHIVLKTDKLPADFYIYFIYRLIVRAARGRNTLEIVILNQNLEFACDDDIAEIIFGEMVEKGEDPSGVPYEVELTFAKNAFNRANEIFQERVTRIREMVTKNNDAFINRRLESLRISYGKNLKLKRQLLEQAEAKERKEQYLRMLKGTIKRLESDLDMKEKELERQRLVGVEYNEIATGILEVI